MAEMSRLEALAVFLLQAEKDGTFDSPGLPPGEGGVLIFASAVPHCTWRVNRENCDIDDSFACDRNWPKSRLHRVHF